MGPISAVVNDMQFKNNLIHSHLLNVFLIRTRIVRDEVIHLCHPSPQLGRILRDLSPYDNTPLANQTGGNRCETNRFRTCRGLRLR